MRRVHAICAQFCKGSALTLRCSSHPVIFVSMYSASCNGVINFSHNSPNHCGDTGASTGIVVCGIVLVAGMYIALLVADIVSCSSAILGVARVNRSSALSIGTYTAVGT